MWGPSQPPHRWMGRADAAKVAVPACVCAPRPHSHPPRLVPGATGVCGAAVSETLLSAVLQCVQGPRDHHVRGKAVPRPPRLCAPTRPGSGRPQCCGTLASASGLAWPPSRCPLQGTRAGGVGNSVAMPQAHPFSPQHTFCRRCALKSGKGLPAPGPATSLHSWQGFSPGRS